MFTSQVLEPFACKQAAVCNRGRSSRKKEAMAACRCGTLLLLLLPLAAMMIDTYTDAAPLVANWSSCGPPRGSASGLVHCCTLPDLMRRSGPPEKYIELGEYLRRHPLPARPRLRRAAHLPEVAGNATYLEQLERAYRLWRELPSHDPRSIGQQVNLHCMYGSEGIVMQHAFPDREYSIHYNWLWLPFHRWYTFFVERILAELVGDDQFVVPFWNWDNQSKEAADGQMFPPNVVPRFYRQPDKYPALFDPKRDAQLAPGQPDVVPDLSLGANPLSGDPDEVRRVNDLIVHRYVVETTWDAPAWLLPGDQARWSFTSRPMRAGEPLVVDIASHDLSFEYKVHGSMHGWVADRGSRMEDFAQIYASVFDALFTAHHANVDRIWAVWQSLGGRDYVDPDYLDAAFFFYSEHAELVRVTVADCLDHRKLGLDWQHVHDSWLSQPMASAASHSLATA